MVQFKIEVQVIQTKVGLSDKCGNGAINLSFVLKSNVLALELGLVLGRGLVLGLGLELTLGLGLGSGLKLHMVEPQAAQALN